MKYKLSEMINEKWKEKTLGEVTSLITKGIPPKYSEKENKTTIWVLNQKCNRNFEISYSEARLHDCSLKKVPENRMLKNGDVLINSTGTGTAGRVAQLHNVVMPTTIDGHMILLRPTDEIDSLYYGYAIKSFQKQIEALAEGSTGQTEINRQRLQNEVIIKFPIDKCKQRNISSFLSNLDKKIKVNIEINKNLEQQAQTLYDKMMVSKVYPLKTLGSITQRNSLKVGNNNSITVLSALNTGNLKPSEEYFSKQVFSKDTSKYILVNEGDFAYNPARINIGSIGINDLGYIGCVSPVYVAFSVDPDYKAFFRFYLKTKGFREECKLRASGSVRQALNYIDFARIETQYPDREEAVIFNQQWNDYHDAICSIVAETEKLIELRDSLLPQLMSGKFNISDINI